VAKLIQSPQAIEDLFEISRGIASDNITAAERLAHRFDDVFRRLADHPQLGERSPSASISDLRLFPVGNYVVYYQVFSDQVWILRVWHAARAALRRSSDACRSAAVPCENVSLFSSHSS